MPCTCEEQTGVWHRVKCLCLHSLTMGWSYFLLFASTILELIFQIPDVWNTLEGSGLTQYIPPHWLPWFTGAIALITIAARLRGILYGGNDARSSRFDHLPDPGPK